MWLSLLSLIVAFAVVNEGGVRVTEWNICLLALGAIALFYLPKTQLPDRRLLWTICAALALALLQLLPLPVFLLRVVSPSRAELLNPADRFAPLSAVPAATVEQALVMAAAAVVFLLVRDLTKNRGTRAWLVVAPLMAVAAIESALGVAQHYLQPPGAGVSGTYGNRNHFSGLLEMCLPFPLMYGFEILGRIRAKRETPALPALACCLLLSVACLIFAGIVLSLSRAGFLTAIASLVFIGVLVLAGKPSSGRRWLYVAPVAALLAIGLIYLPADMLVSRFGAVDIAAEARPRIWRESFRLIAAFPLFGCGLGAYGSTFMRYQSVAPTYTIDYAHNDYIQILAEFGTFGFLIVMAIAGMIFTRAIRGSMRSRQRSLAIACAGGLGALLLHSFADFNLYIPANVLVLAWISGITDGLRVRAATGPLKDEAVRLL